MWVGEEEGEGDSMLENEAKEGKRGGELSKTRREERAREKLRVLTLPPSHSKRSGKHPSDDEYPS